MTPGSKISKEKWMGKGMSLSWAEFLSYWSNWVLVGALVAGVIATYLIVVTGNVKEEYLKRDVAAAKLRGDEAIAQAEADRLARVTIEQEILKQLRPRDLSKQQFNDLVSALKGKVNKKLSVHTQTDSEARSFGFAIMDALTTAEVKFDWIQPTAEKNDFSVPGLMLNSAGLIITLYVASVAEDHEAKELVQTIVDAFVKAGVPIGGSMPDEPLPGIPSPSLFISKRQLPFTWFPEYLAPAGLPRPPWEPK